MKSITLTVDQGIATLTLDAPGESVNTMNRQFQDDLAQAVDQLHAQKESIAGVVLVSAKSTFFAGGDLRSLIRVTPDTAKSFFEEIEAMKASLRKLEKLGKPVVAALNGSALGGGLELALSCHHRVCIDDDKIQIGFPEVTLGLLPGAGGVVKSVRLMGLMNALPFLSEGKRIAPKAAQAMGLIHTLVADKQSLVPAAIAWIKSAPSAVQPWDEPKFKIPGGSPSSPAVASMLPIAPAVLTSKTRGNFPAPEAILAAAVEGAQVDFDTAMRIESRYLTQLASGQVSKNMIGTFFFQLNEIKSGKSRPAGPARWKANKVGILGAGMMGAGIAYACAMRSVPCVLKDVSLEKAEQGKAYTGKLLAKRVEKNRMTPAQAQAVLDLITPSAQASDLAGCDLVIEAVFENRDLKAQVTQEAQAVLGASVLFTSNTSTLPITGLAKASADPARFVGLHFFSPVDKMELVEIIRGAQTSDESLAQAYDFVQQIGKMPIVVNDSRGFYTSRVFGTFVNEGMALLGEGVAPATIENIAMQLGMPVGPLAVLDEVSLKLADDVLHQELVDLEHEAHQHHEHDHAHHDHEHDHAHHDHDHAHHDHDHAHHDHDHAHHDHDHAHHDHSHHNHSHKVKSKRMPESAVYVLEKMAHGFKRMGRAHGSGFYDYDQGTKSLWPGLSVFARGAKVTPLDDVRDRMLYAQALETVRCLDEGVLTSARDANIGSIFGWGFPAYTGGTLQYVNHVGTKAFVERAQALAAKYGERFTPPARLIELAKTNAPLTA